LNLSVASVTVIEQMYEDDSLFDPSRLPPGLAGMAPGSALGNLVAAIDSPSLSRYERVKLISACQKMVSHYQALLYREVATLFAQQVAEDPEAPIEDSAWSVKTELGAALHLSNRSVELVFDFALLLQRASGVSPPFPPARSITTGRRCLSTAPAISPTPTLPGWSRR
jgi:hypothetical protein